MLPELDECLLAGVLGLRRILEQIARQRPRLVLVLLYPFPESSAHLHQNKRCSGQKVTIYPVINAENYRKQLLAQQYELRQAQESGEQAEQPVELDQTRVGRLSRMDAMQVQAMSVETGRRRRQKLRQIAAALKRIENDDFGYCQECDEEIAPARLEIEPTVLLCINCASARESHRE